MEEFIYFRGKLFSGTGEASSFTELSWFKEFVRSHFGFDNYPGTFNLRAADLQARSDLRNLHKSDRGNVLISPDPQYCSSVLFHAIVEKRIIAAVVVPKVEGYPDDVIELVSYVRLRQELNVEDGQELHVKISI